RAAMTALAFIKSKDAANAMVSLSASEDREMAAQATYWLTFRQSNDWNKFLDLSKIGLNVEYQKRLTNMLIKKQMMMDEHQAKSDRIRYAIELAADSVGGQILMGMAAENKIPT